MTAFEVHNLIRALVDSYPNAFSYYNGQKISIRKSRIIDEIIKGTPGRIPLKRDEGIIVIAKDKGLLISEMTIEERGKIINPKEFFKIGTDFSNSFE